MLIVYHDTNISKLVSVTMTLKRTETTSKEYMIAKGLKEQLENQMVLNYREQKEMKKKEKEQQQGWP